MAQEWYFDGNENKWREIREHNAALCGRGAEVRRAVKRACDYCEGAAAGWAHLQAELAQLPATVQLMQEMTARTAASCAQIEVLEQRLSSLAAARVKRAEAQRREQQLEEAQEHEAARRQQQEQLRLRMAEETLHRQQQAQEERRQIFEEQFLEQRAYVDLHGVDVPLPPAPPDSAPCTLADVRPATLADEAELDAFYDD